MTFFCDVIIRVSFKMSLPRLYVLEVWQRRMRLCCKRQYFSFVRALFSIFSILSLPQKIASEICFSMKVLEHAGRYITAKLCHYQQNVPQHYCLLDTLVAEQYIFLYNFLYIFSILSLEKPNEFVYTSLKPALSVIELYVVFRQNMHFLLKCAKRSTQ